MVNACSNSSFPSSAHHFSYSQMILFLHPYSLPQLYTPSYPWHQQCIPLEEHNSFLPPWTQKDDSDNRNRNRNSPPPNTTTLIYHAPWQLLSSSIEQGYHNGPDNSSVWTLWVNYEWIHIIGEYFISWTKWRIYNAKDSKYKTPFLPLNASEIRTHTPNRWGWRKKFLNRESWLAILVNETRTQKAVLEGAEGEEIHQVNDTVVNPHFLVSQPRRQTSNQQNFSYGYDYSTIGDKKKRRPVSSTHLPSLSILPPHSIYSTALT